MRIRTIGPIVTLVLGLLAAPLLADAQQAGKIYRIGYLLVASSRHKSRPSHKGFLQELRKYGFVAGDNLVVEYRFADGKRDRLPDLATELVQSGVDVIFTFASGVSAARKATTTIPIVFVGVTDPVAAGIVDSLARPGGNLTGFSNTGLDLNPKRLELLVEAVPGVTRVAVLRNSRSRFRARVI